MYLRRRFNQPFVYDVHTWTQRSLMLLKSMGWKYVLESYLDSGPKNKSLENKRFKKWVLKVEIQVDGEFL